MSAAAGQGGASFKHLFTRALGASPGRLHLAAHSHHLWPDASRLGQLAAWDDAARLADRKWDRVMGELWPRAQAEVAAELGPARPESIVFSANTHDLLLRVCAAAPRRFGRALHVLTSDGEFHSASRQFARWAEDGAVELTIVPAEPFATLGERMIAAAATRRHDLVWLSHVLFASGTVVDGLAALAALADPAGPWVAIDGYHSFMALAHPLPAGCEERLLWLGGGYKYAMAGEGMGFLHVPPGFGERPPLTGWYAGFTALSHGGRPGPVGYPADAMRFIGATFDPSALYRFVAVRGMLADAGLDTAAVSAHVAALQRALLEALAHTPLERAELLNPLAGGPHARFLAWRSPDAERWRAALAQRGCIVDVRGEVLRVGLGLYHDMDDIAAFAALAGELGQ